MPIAAVTILCLLVAVGPASADADPPKAMQINRVVRELADEARRALKEADGQYPPRSEANYAADAGGALTHDEVIKALQRRLDRTPLIDAYIKWQLLSFRPELGSLEARDIMRIVDALPEFEVMGKLSRADYRIAQTYGNKPGIPAEAYRRLKKIAEQYPIDQAKIAALNKPNLDLRKELMKHLPDQPGVEMLALLQEAVQRMRGGDKYWKGMVDKIEKMAEAIREDPTWSPALRKALRQRVMVLNTVQTERITSFTAQADGEVIVRIQKVQANQKQLERITAYLDGRVPIQ